MLIVWLSPLPVKSQSCPGSQSDPVAVIDFGTLQWPGIVPAKGVSASYQFQAGDCMREGQYGLRHQTFRCYNDGWVTTLADHTPGDQNGLMLMVNGGDPGPFYTDTLSGLCGETTYTLSWYGLNLSRFTSCNTLIPRILVTVETITGVKLQEQEAELNQTGRVDWQVFECSFRPPPAASAIVVRFSSLSPSTNCGNDFAIDDITLRPCVPGLSAAITGNSGLQLTLCEDDVRDLLLTASVPAELRNAPMQWQIRSEASPNWTPIAGAGTPTYRRLPSEPGSYRYRLQVTAGACSFQTNDLQIDVLTKPFASSTNYVNGCLGSPITLFSSGGATYLWTGPNGYRSPTQEARIAQVKFSDEGWYIVEVATAEGCRARDSTYLVVYPAARISVAGDTTVCRGDSVSLRASGGISYQWFPAQGLSNANTANPRASPSADLTYRVVAINENGCSDTGYTRVKVAQLPRANAGPVKAVLPGIPVQLDGAISGTDVAYYWTPAAYLSDARALKPMASPPTSQWYTLHAVSRAGCGTDTSGMMVKVYDSFRVPNAFSPNGDGINDVWVLEILPLFPGSRVQVFDRHGRVVFASTGYDRPWDGTSAGRPLPVGVYYYVITLPGTAGRYAGSVTLIR